MRPNGEALRPVVTEHDQRSPVPGSGEREAFHKDSPYTGLVAGRLVGDDAAWKLQGTRRPPPAPGDSGVAATNTRANGRTPPVSAAEPHETEHPDMDWRSRAACLDEDPELFFPIGNTGPALAQIEEAKKVCRRCEVREVCLQWALDHGQDAGVWGGMSEDERRALRRKQARARAR
jgi:WhiB family redox-sensing transcriptional regulator